MVYYYFPEPPYFLLVAGLFVSLTSGVAFSTTLKQTVRQWSKESSHHLLSDLKGIPLAMPFIGIAIGICIFLSAGLEIFSFPASIAFSASLVLTALSSGLIWYQLNQLFARVERDGAAAAFDLDSFQ